MSRYSLAGNTALVTGGAKRLGLATATALADKGANVILHYRSSGAEAESVAAELSERGVCAWAIQADLADTGEAEQLMGRAVQMAGPVDILVNNASIFDPSTLDDVTFDDVSDNAAVNTWAPFILSREFARQGRPGRIVNLLDTRVNGYDWAHVGYILSKHMLHVLTRMTALQYAPQITVNAVAPGLILPPPGQDGGYLDQFADSLPLKRHGDADDITSAIVFLLECEFTTGQVIYVDGGRHLREGS